MFLTSTVNISLLATNIIGFFTLLFLIILVTDNRVFEKRRNYRYRAFGTTWKRGIRSWRCDGPVETPIWSLLAGTTSFSVGRNDVI